MKQITQELIEEVQMILFKGIHPFHSIEKVNSVMLQLRSLPDAKEDKLKPVNTAAPTTPGNAQPPVETKAP